MDGGEGFWPCNWVQGHAGRGEAQSSNTVSHIHFSWGDSLRIVFERGDFSRMLAGIQFQGMNQKIVQHQVKTVTVGKFMNAVYRHPIRGISAGRL